MDSSTADALATLSRAIDQAETVLAATTPDQLSAPTPCKEWDVAALAAHLVADPANFVTMGRGDKVDWSAARSLPDDWTAAFRSGADELLATWQAAGESATSQAIDWQTAEFAVHTWDLATATGQSIELDPQVAQRGLDFMSGALTPENRGQAFGPEVAIDANAAAPERLAAFAGRMPQG